MAESPASAIQPGGNGQGTNFKYRLDRGGGHVAIHSARSGLWRPQAPVIDVWHGGSLGVEADLELELPRFR